MAEGARGIAKVVVESGDITINGGTVTAIGTNAGMDCARSNIVVKPSAGKSIAVTAGENAESAAALAGSPFTSETTITDLVSEKKYVHHTAAERDGDRGRKRQLQPRSQRQRTELSVAAEQRRWTELDGYLRRDQRQLQDWRDDVANERHAVSLRDHERCWQRHER